MTDKESCLQVQVIRFRDELETIRKLKHERNVAGEEQRHTKIRYNIAATLKANLVSIQHLIQENYHDLPRNCTPINGV
jgi:hypothetical protein